MIKRIDTETVKALELARQMVATQHDKLLAGQGYGPERLYRMGLYLPGRTDEVRLFGGVMEQYALSYFLVRGTINQYEQEVAAMNRPGDYPLVGVFPVNDLESFKEYQRQGRPPRKKA